jgi:hypothetical protein
MPGLVAISSFANQHSSNILIILFMMQASKKIPFDDPMVLNACRAIYVASNLLILGLYYYCKMQIDKKNGMTTHTLRV